MQTIVTRATAVRGSVTIPPDKSIAHRAALFAALARGTSVVRNFPDAEDPRSTLSCLQQLGVSIEEPEPGTIVITGRGRKGLQAPQGPVDCGNSGTTMRLLAGMLAGCDFASTLVGDASLSSRPMQRIAAPLQAMGARIALTEGHAPMHIRGGSLQAMTYTLPIPSAQVKSCVLLAGLFASGMTIVVEPIQSRDHTERMLQLPVRMEGETRHISSHPEHIVQLIDTRLPGDFSSAAFFLVAGSIVPDGGPLHLADVGQNPTRAALLSVLRSMGADIRTTQVSVSGREPVATYEVHPAPLRGVTVSGDIVPKLIDELPILAIAGTCAEGRTVIRDARELRVKECDRIHATVTGLRALGAIVEEFEDGLAVEGGHPLRGAAVESFGDHRIAMALGVAGLVAEGATTIQGSEAASISYPGFWETLDDIAVRP